MRMPGLLGVGLALAACSPAQPANSTPDAPDVQTRREMRVDTSEVRIGGGSEVAVLQAVLSRAPGHAPAPCSSSWCTRDPRLAESVVRGGAPAFPFRCHDRGRGGVQAGRGILGDFRPTR
jgi:hypothetical protein